ncbi:MAG: hypothetical protein LJE87_15780, partial [Deltaproteobacteria bacterium]|nr:hypothetical protein [Deltaproteobacteria bacterium]
MLKLSLAELHEAIEYLYEALEILEAVLKEIENGSIRGVRTSERLAEAWYKVNCCRLHTESDVNLEELTLEAMGLINDAKCMMDSLMSWRKGMTLHGMINITNNIRAASDNLRLVL